MSGIPIGPERVSRFRPVPIEQVVLLPPRPLPAWILVGKLAVGGDKGGGGYHHQAGKGKGDPSPPGMLQQLGSSQ